MTTLPNSTAARDIASLVHPYTNLDKHQAVGPFLITRGDGCYVEADQRQALSGGHGRPVERVAGIQRAAPVAAAAARQLETLPYSHLFGHRSHDPAIDLAEKLLGLAPAGMSKVMFANSGSEANDQAIKLVWYYHKRHRAGRRRRS